MLLENKKARLNFEFLEKFEAGVDLLGFEVKSLRAKHGSLGGAYISVREGEAWLVGVFIPPYQPANTPSDFNPYRPRRLLLTREEISYLSGKGSSRGLTIVPVSIYNKKGRIKVEMAVVRGKKKHDKRETLKRREAEREIRRTLKKG
ncbi:MAG: SsrA-binding protein SmpB [Candidatus Taylorbacteria bacterium]|nr:SsrA-binding protein SmpB [Candidatus Taylorbacteria bacterium]